MADFLPELLMFAKTSAVQAVKGSSVSSVHTKCQVPVSWHCTQIIHSSSFGELHIPSSQIVRAGSNFPPVGQ